MLMRELLSEPEIYLLIEDETAFFNIDKKQVFQLALTQAQNSAFNPKVRIFCPEVLQSKYNTVFSGEIDLVVSKSLKQFLSNIRFQSQIIIFHNVSRPLVPSRVYDQGIKMLLQGWDAVKQKHVVVDTLKRINEQNFVVETVNRDLVKAVTSPEFYWTDNISGTSNEISWLYSILDEANKDYIYGELESTRIRTKQDLFLIEALMKQKGLT